MGRFITKWHRVMPVFLLAFVLATGGCARTMIWGPLGVEDFPPPGPPNYQQGILDGCKTALSAVGNFITGLIYKGVHYDVQKALNDKVYYQAWKDGYFFCKFDYDRNPE